MSPAEARRFVLMHMLDDATRRAENWRDAARLYPDAAAIAAEWDRQRETLLRAVQASDTQFPTAPVGITRARHGKGEAA